MSHASISILCVDDEPGLADLIGTYLERFDDGFVVTPTASAQEALGQLDSGHFDCIVSDYEMPGMDGLALLETVRAERPEFPFILYTGHGSEEIASDAISAGVTDYMQKTSGTDQYQVLARRIRNAVERRRLAREGVTGPDYAERVLETSPDAIVVAVDSHCVYANSSASELLSGDGSTTIVGEPITSLAHSATTDGDHERTVPEPDGATGLTRERLVLATDARERPIEVIVRPITWDGDEGAVYVFRDISERVAAERELEYQQSLVNATFETSPDGILVTTTDRELATHNDQFLDRWGLSENAFASTDSERVFEAMRDRVADAETFQQHIETQYEQPSSTRRSLIRLEDGTVLDQYSAPIGAGNTQHGHIWFFRDVTDLRGADQAGHARQETFDRMTDAVFALNDDWQFTFLNERAAALLQRDIDELLGTHLWSEFPGMVETDLHDRYHEAVETGDPVSFEMDYEPLGSTFEIRAFPSETGLTVYFRDITERRRTETQLRAAVDALHELYTVASDQELSFEAKQEELVALGTAYLDLPYGFVTEITDGRQLITAATGTHELLQPGESCPLSQSYCRKTIATEDGLLAVENAGGSGWSGDPGYELFELETYIGGRVVVNDELYGTICFASSDSRDWAFSEMEQTFVEVMARWLSYELEQRSYQSQLEETNDQLEEFASIVSHDLRNPLTVATMRLELARDEHDSEHLDDIGRAHTRMETLIEEILTLAREGDVIDELTDVDLATVSQSCWAHVDTREATVVIDTDSRLVADESRLAQLLENLIRNAVEHGGSDVTITIGDLPNGFYVEDDGVGIPEDQRATLFESGYSTKTDGPGIGLRIVEKVAAAHGWAIAVTTGSAGGARFEITGVERP